MKQFQIVAVLFLMAFCSILWLINSFGLVLLWAALLIFFVICGYETYKIVYFKSKLFEQLYQTNEILVKDINEFNAHLKSLCVLQIYNSKQVITNLVDNSKYRMSRPGMHTRLSGDNVYDCSLTVCKNSQSAPLNYLKKYFGVEFNEHTLSAFEQMLNNFVAVEQGIVMLRNRHEAFMASIDKSVPGIIWYFNKSEVMDKLGLASLQIADFSFPKFYFQYISAGGNSSLLNEIELSPAMLEIFINQINDKIRFANSVKGQRQLMTKALREFIKNRDNYTCVYCSASVLKEPNLLLEVDHIHAVSRGGRTEETNLQTLCWRCNRTKGAKIFNLDIEE